MVNFDKFADLRTHSHYSYRDGVCDIETLVARAVELGRPAMALTDHHHAAGFIELQEAADKLGLSNPIFGAEMAVFWPDETALEIASGEWANYSCGAEAERQVSAKPSKNAPRHIPTHNLELLAIDETGLNNLFSLLTWAGTEGYDAGNQEEARLSEVVLLEKPPGLAILAGGAGGKLACLLTNGHETEAAAWAATLREAFGTNFFVELVAQKTAAADNARLIKFARQHNLPLIATSDVHYVKPEQARARDLLWAINDNVRFDASGRRRPLGEDALPLPLERLAEFFSEVPEALANAAELADKCRVRLPKAGASGAALLLPEVVVPAEFNTPGAVSPAGRYLSQMARTTLEKRFGKTLPEKMTLRLDYELGVIERAGFSPYILIVADIVQRAHALNILCAPRGSSAGSLVCYAVGITPINPLDYDLLFERFLNEARIAPPDIDLDIADEARPRLLDYVVRKYGAANVAHIVTHNFEGAKSALRDAGKALGTDPMLVNQLVNLVPIEFQRPWSLTRSVTEEQQISRLYQQNTAVRELIDHALLIEGTGRNSGTHAAGVVITPRPIAEYVPLVRTEGLGQQQRAEAEREASIEASATADNPDQLADIEGATLLHSFTTPKTMTQWDMEGVEKRGLLKIDLLGLTAWTTIGNALKYIKQERGLELDVWTLPTDDATTYETIGKGHTLGIFQLEKPGMREFTINMKPRNIADLALLIAAYRPGPMPYIHKIAAVRNGKEPLQAPHPMLEPLLAESYGAPVYQETMLKIAREVAGYSLGEADVLRKAVGKKDVKLLAENERKFLAGALAKGLTKEQAQAVWQMFPPFAYYGFNQAHAIIYGYLTYITAYLKVNYSLEFIAAMLSVAGGDTEAVVKAVREARRMKVALRGPEVNRSERRITIEDLPEGGKGLRLGLAAIKGLGPTGVEAIMAARHSEGDFNGLAEFIKRVPGRAVNTRALSALIKVGAFPFGNRAQLEEVLPAAQKAAKAKTFSEPALPDVPETSLTAITTNEKALLGFALSE